MTSRIDQGEGESRSLVKGDCAQQGLRKWFGHDPERWKEFQTHYRAELKQNTKQVSLLKQEAAKGAITLLYGAKDEEHNEAVVLQRLLTSK